ncbi:putative outer membrane starch-binding protein [Sphingobacterium allocomposti]|uniref:Putative outer membrane starch-binding protein n=1 Tax=Sphingobacterium allocomposti TaxID=415956 RepID=A0A5S5D849_9SPHI|nr:RagB/SusD family nutrient uptake outer membrane protein [Sphingobacterium composti Yoo et al. 2007 non Ten et al. 2007]TYP92257.1 putative outer membrane starch-binding protein [Sphingobacterium composti Yoo et al. 2007 non Ten et al. 2007]HLS94578.1 RagB/SusD family nutrient uptake outer membrane protein [Sphingobacterium sp.]
MKFRYKHKNKLYASVLLGALIFSSCSDFLDRFPQDQISDETYWQTQEQLEMAVTAIYSRVKAKNFVDMENLGENTMWPSTNQYKDIGSGVFPTTQPTVNDEWRNMYRDIRECNAFLENYGKAQEDQPGAKERLAAEVRVIRALGYSFLTSFYGDIPLITKTLNPDDPEVYAGRDPQSEVVDFLLKELDEAAEVLPAAIPSGENLGRVSKGTALALKSRIALAYGRYEVAEAAAKAVMDLGVYELYSNGDPSTSYWELFTRAGKLAGGRNKETIFARLHLTDVIMHNLSREIQVPDQFARFVPTRSLVESYLCSDGLPIDKSPLYSDQSYEDVFKNRDPRMTQTILVPGDTWGGRYDGRPTNENPDPSIFMVPKFSQDGRGSVTTTGYYYKKYVEPTAVPNYNRDDNDIHHIRYAEVLLNYAEARLEQNKLTQADLDISINLLRDRVGMKRMDLNFLAQHGMDVRTEIRRERRIELALEGHRYFDVRRWKEGERLGRDIEGVKASWFPQLSSATYRKSPDGYLSVQWNRAFEDPKNYLWPVPEVQRERNPALGQNPGW